MLFYQGYRLLAEPEPLERLFDPVVLAQSPPPPGHPPPKPDPLAFQNGLALLGPGVEARDVVYVGENHAEVLGARLAGLRGILVVRRGSLPAGEANAAGIAVRWLITQKDGAPNFSMRVIEVEPGGYSPFHNHPWEHEVFILKGSGVLVQENQETPFSEGDVIFIPPSEQHQLKNTAEQMLEFICLIPHLYAEE